MLCISNYSYAQWKHDYTWAMGYDCCRGDENDNYLLDFNGGRLRIDTATLQEEFFRAGQICDKNGRLALYTKGCKLYNGNNEVVVNGDSMIVSDSMNYICITYGRQGIVILPDSYQDDTYWMFYKSQFIRNKRPPGSHLVSHDAFRYSLINIRNKNGRGEVIKKNVSLISDTSLVYGNIAAVKHENNLDWWIITSSDSKDINYYIVLLHQNGIGEIKSQKIGNKIKNLGNDSDGFLFSPDGQKLARFFHEDGLYLFDFDRSQGVLSNFKKIDFPNSGSKYGGLAFSPSGRFLYVATDTILYQYDFWETDSAKAMMEVGWFDYFHERWYTTFYTMQLGPDCRIYMATYPGSRYLHVIKYPDQKGTSCEFLQHVIQLPYYNDYYMPYFPNFRLGYAPVCDSTIGFVGTSIITEERIFIQISPNPVHDFFTIELELPQSQEVNLQLKDLNGQPVLRKDLNVDQNKHEIDVQTLIPGMYIYNLYSKQGLIASGKIVKI